MNAIHPALPTEQRQAIDTILQANDYHDYKWIDPQKIIVAQWVRMKCMFGCGEYGWGGACPPNTPSVTECERFFREYRDAIILHFAGQMEKPEDRHAWSAKINARLVKLERAVFLAGFERAFLLFMDSCCFCKDCTGRAWPGRRRNPWPWMSTPPCGRSVSISTCARTTTSRWTAMPS